MKKVTLLLVVIVFAFGMNVNAQDIAMVSNTTMKSTSENDNVSPEVKKLKAEFLKEIKQQYFVDKGLAVPSSLEIILMSEIYGKYYVYFTYENKMACLYKGKAGNYSIWNATFISSRHKQVRHIIFKK